MHHHILKNHYQNNDLNNGQNHIEHNIQPHHNSISHGYKINSVLSHNLKGSHIHLNDSHNSTISLNPTRVDPPHGIVCGHGDLTTHPFQSGPIHNTTIHNTTISIGGDRCIMPNGDGCITITGPHEFGDPNLTFGFRIDW
jgi:hypothetical protein